ncbi:hypothetical protein [Paenibacillus thermotolerans]|uniref:hypothetical protein n=1 Tax=Paenibacillus thermotolerans TaxID=3027807 RepID=UPI0023687325|nr:MULTISPECIES: hypothetical protein [unclassified Paenibacillus]
MDKKFGLMMSLPEGKLPGYYAQVVKNVAAAAVLFDRDKELLIADTEHDRNEIAKALEKMKIEWEPLSLLLLPENAGTTRLFSDFGFVSKFGNTYLYSDSVSLFRCSEEQPADAETAPALLQLEELVVAEFAWNDATWYAIDQDSRLTAEGIAQRYHCSLEFLE